MNNNITLSNEQFDRLLKNATSAGISPSILVGQMLDDEFGGLVLGKRNDASLQSIQNHVRSLGTLLKQR